ncbi:hypothetical protein [Fodinibius sediminis]|uniref:Uncharacterized protein n=1 Tax=Fodinibius sediminis TaxID=1214077 RepID=A0A521D4T0_9BACT|nr:hypothetical protein [Fodinibius sediminis]SMO66677.1 hypothetical protein SAMN06265218_108145 [Fodinibius sediminis]
MINPILILRYLSDDCTPGEESAVEQWFRGDGRNTYVMEEYRTIWELSKSSEVDFRNLFDVEIGWLELRERMSAKSVQMDYGNVEERTVQDDFPLRIRLFLEE